MKKRLLTLSMFAGMVAFTACKKDAVDYAAQATCTGSVPTYTSDIASILNTNCALSGCHNANSAKEGINLSAYEAASSQFINNSNNLISIHHGSGAKPMPEGRPQLSADLINKLDCWVKNGCPQ
jgi:hypothetical protein